MADSIKFPDCDISQFHSGYDDDEDKGGAAFFGCAIPLSLTLLLADLEARLGALQALPASAEISRINSVWNYRYQLWEAGSIPVRKQFA